TFSQLAVIGELFGKDQLRGVDGYALQPDRFDAALGEALTDAPQVGFEPADHDRLELFWPDLDSPGEALWIKHLQQGRETIGVPVVRGRGQKQSMLEASGEIADGPGNLAIDGIAGAARRSGVMCLIEDEEGTWAEVAQSRAQSSDVGFVG